MWYFLIRQGNVSYEQYRALQRKAALTEVELFNDPYENWYVLSVEKEHYTAFVDQLDRQGIVYDLRSDRPLRDELLSFMR